MSGLDPDWERAPCPQCGAHTEEEAAGKCRPTQTQNGDYACGQPENDVDDEGYFLRLTEAGLRRLDAWVDEQVAALHSEGEKR